MNSDSRVLLMQGAHALGVVLSADDAELFRRFAEELVKWSRKINLTAITTEAEIVVKHFLDSLTLLQVVGDAGRLADIGAGAGFPSIPVKIVRPRLVVVSVDAVEKKVVFQRHAARILGLEGIEAIHARGEKLAEGLSCSFDWVVSRAFSDIPAFARMALPLLAPGGSIIAMKGRGGREEAERAEPLIADMGVRIAEIREFELPISGDRRSLIIMSGS